MLPVNKPSCGFLNLAVTFVPITNCNGISGGRSLKLLMSAVFLCCNIRIFCLFLSSSRLSSSKNDCEHLRGFPIILLILHHSTRVSLRLFNCGNDSFKHIMKSLSPSNNTLQETLCVLYGILGKLIYISLILL